MARTVIEGFDTRTSILSGTSSIQNTVARNSGYALRSNPTTSGTGFASVYTANNTVRLANISFNNYFRFYFHYLTKPLSGYEPFFVLQNGVGVNRAFLVLGSDGKISLLDSTANLIVTGNTVLQPSTWYRIEIKGQNSATGVATLLINGTTEFSVTGNFTTSNAGFAMLGKATNINSQSVDFYYDDFSIDNSTWCGEGFIEALMPTGNGGAAGFTTGTNLSDYQEIDDTPSDTDTTYVRTVGASIASYSHGAAKSNPIKAVRTGSWAKLEAGSASYWTGVRSAGNNLFSGSTATPDSGAYSLHANILNSLPNLASGAPWTKEGLDACEIAIQQAGTGTVRVTQAFLEVEYGSNKGAGSLMGVG